MLFFSALDITEISLVFSVAGIGLVILVLVLIRRQIANLKLLDASVDASALVKQFAEREKRLEERLVDQKVRLEVLELRLSKQANGGHYSTPENKASFSAVDDPFFEKEPTASFRHVMKDIRLDQLSSEAPSSPFVRRQSSSADRRLISSNNESGALATNKRATDRTVHEVLRIVLNAEGNVTARQIQERIGRSREHTARMMNLLFKQGLLSRDAQGRPFTYSLTDAGKRELNP